MIEFQLFRVKVYRSAQMTLLPSPRERSQILREAIESVPSADLRKGATWHIGNVAHLDSNGLYFRIGRTSKSTIEVYADGDFEDQEFETAPYTHVILDVKLGVCAIAKKDKLSQTIRGTANKLGRLLDESKTAHDLQTEFEIDPIMDPADLISYLSRAASISRFWITFKRPNPFDVNVDFVKPMHKLLTASQARQGKTEIKGENLDAKNLEDLARSAASTGDEAVADLKLSPKGNKLRKRLKDRPVIIKYKNLDDVHQGKSLLHRIRQEYDKIRGRLDSTK